MPAEKCAACGSSDTGAMLNTFVCHNCGAVTNYRGDLVARETTEPVAPDALVGSMGPVDSSDPANPVRVVTVGDESFTVPADPEAVSRLLVVGTPEYDAANADVPAEAPVPVADPEPVPATTEAEATA